MKVLVIQSPLTLCNPMDGSLPVSSVRGILQARILTWVAISSSRGSSWPRDRTLVSCIASGFLTTEPLGRPSQPGPVLWVLLSSIKEGNGKSHFSLRPKSFVIPHSWLKAKVLDTQSCPTLCNPMNCNPPGSSVHGILQARILEWVAISFSRVTSQPRDRAWETALQADSLLSEPPGKLRHSWLTWVIQHSLIS